MNDYHTCKVPRLIPYYGAKHRLAMKYPPPEYPTIIEPFVGSAAYSSLYSDREIILIDKDPVITSIWKWLTSASKEEITELPLIQPGELVNGLDTHQAAKWLIGFWCGNSSAIPNKQLSPRFAKIIGNFQDSGTWYVSGRRWNHKCVAWHEPVKERIINSLDRISHWSCNNADYSDSPDIEATWFIDPPYTVAGKCYPCSKLDYDHLANWCLSRKGQVIVCENEGANWLPFEYLNSFNGKRRTEVIFTENSPNWTPPLQPLDINQHNLIDWLRVD